MTKTNEIGGSGFAPNRRTVLAGLTAAALVSTRLPAAFAAVPTSGKLTITVLDFLEAPLKPVFEAYKKARPGVEIEYNVAPSHDTELIPLMMSRALAGKLTDIVFLFDELAALYADAGITADLRPFFESGGPVTASYFAKPFLDQYLITSGDKKGGYYGLPYGADTVVQFYNKRHFDEAGIAYPNGDWTFDEMIAIADKLTQRDGDKTTRYGLAAQIPWQATYVPGIEAWGGSVLREDGTIDLTSDAALKTFTMYWDQAKKGIIASYTQSPNGDIWSAFSSGFASMTQTVRALVPSFRASMKDDWDVCFTPKINGVHKTGMGSLAMDATPSGIANNADLVYDFITWYYSGEGAMGILASTYAIVPPVESLYDSPTWRDLPGPPHNTSVFSDSIAFGAINPNTIPHSIQSIINKQLRDAEDSVVLNGADPKEQLANAEAAVNQALAEEIAKKG
ncbi:MAG TPA: extracellular solute-binding protein [Devosia sp.]|nr:extracellular solute-binding protein [Devosia sp.]